ncbi:MAG: flagellar biosynthetic protein FliO [bacterium]|jgi:flagellar protein FliO/FliZ
MKKYLRQFTRQRKTMAILACLLGGIILLSLFQGPKAGSDGSPVDEAGPGSPMMGQDMRTMSMKIIGSVVLVVGLLYAVMYAMKRFGPGLRLGGIKENAISVMHKRHIAPKKAIYILKIGQRSMVVGVTDSQINHLADLTEEDLESISAEDAPKGGGFRQYLFGAESSPRSRS